MHPSDAELLALIDGQLTPEQGEGLRDHLSACPACESRTAELEALVGRNRELLASLESRDLPLTTAGEVVDLARERQRRASRMPNTLLRAASIAVLAATAAVVVAMPGSPVRETILRVVERARPAPERVSEADSGSRTAGVAVRPSGRLVITFAAVQAAGTIEVAIRPTTMARIETPDRGVSFVVASDSVAVDNARSTASYVVILPDALPSAEIRVAGVTVFRKTGRASHPPAASDRRLSLPFSSIE